MQQVSGRAKVLPCLFQIIWNDCLNAIVFNFIVQLLFSHNYAKSGFLIFSYFHVSVYLLSHLDWEGKKLKMFRITMSLQLVFLLVGCMLTDLFALESWSTISFSICNIAYSCIPSLLQFTLACSNFIVLGLSSGPGFANGLTWAGWQEAGKFLCTFSTLVNIKNLFALSRLHAYSALWIIRRK